MFAHDYFAGLLNSENGLHEYFRLAPPPELFKGEELELYELFKRHSAKYGTLPSRETIQAETGVLIATTKPAEPPEFYLDKMSNRHIFLGMKSTMLMAQDLMNDDQPTKALELTKKHLTNMTVFMNQNRTVDYSKSGYDIVKDAYTKAAKGIDPGIMSGWAHLDEMTNGMAGGDVMSLVGRPGAGKTYLLLYMALHAWYEHGEVPMFVSMEMKPKLLIQRLAAMNARVSISKLKKGFLPDPALDRLLETLGGNRKGRPPFWIIDGALSANIEDIIMYARQFKPTSIYIDGAYLLSNANTRMSRWERVCENAERIKGDIAESLDLPVHPSYQFNRDAVKGGKKLEAKLENIGGSDAIGQVSSVVLAMMNPETVETLTSRDVTIMKGRSGETGEFRINWKFDSGPDYMNFTQLPEDTSEMNFY